MNHPEPIVLHSDTTQITKTVQELRQLLSTSLPASLEPIRKKFAERVAALPDCGIESEIERNQDGKSFTVKFKSPSLEAAIEDMRSEISEMIDSDPRGCAWRTWVNEMASACGLEKSPPLSQ